MSVSGFIILAIVVVAAGYAVAIYNSLVSVKHNVSKAWSNIDVLLKQRHDELPKLIETCKQYMKHEKETLEQVMLARSGVSEALGKSDVAGLGQAETKMRQGLLNLFAVAEAYPDLKADQSFNRLMDELSGTENRISTERMRYNRVVKTYNTTIKKFPGRFYASLFGFEKATYYEVPEEEKAVPKVEF